MAPQYPQGLGLRIHVDRIEGAAPHDLQNINGLNHYIGMHKIEPDTIHELRYMKFFALGLAVTAALVALIRRRSVLLAWVIIAIALSGIGMYDFYQWEYRYGHDLDPSAAIKVPGMSYQPPLFGTRQMLNFTATAWPGVGGWLAMIAVALACACVVYEYRLRRKSEPATCCAIPPATAATSMGLLCAIVVAGSLLGACTKEPATIAMGTDACEHCSMTITNPRYGAVLVNDKGRSYKFDSVECMVEALAEDGTFNGRPVHSFHVMDFSNPGHVIDALHATFLVSTNLPSPMGANVTSFARESDAGEVQKDKGGDLMNWSEIQKHLHEWAHS